MKELSAHIQAQEQVIQKEFPKKVKHLGKIRLHKGQKLWQCDLTTGKVSPVEIDITATLTGVTKKHIIQDGFLYDTAINLKNAERKFIKKLRKILQ